MSKKKKEEQPVLVWDECDIAEGHAEYLLEEAKENGEELTEDEARKIAYEDSFTYESAWDDLCYELTELMKRLDTDHTDRWYGESKNFGWRSLDGVAESIVASNGKELLQKTLPKCECSFKIYDRGDHIAINNAHHDSPCFAEWYYIWPKFQCGECGEDFRKEELHNTTELGDDPGDFMCEACFNNYKEELHEKEKETY